MPLALCSATNMARRLVHWLPALLYMGLIFMLSSQSNLPAPYEFPESDKVFHVLAYAPLGFLMVYALSRSTLRLEPRPWPGALAQDSAPGAYWKVPRACPWGSLKKCEERLGRLPFTLRWCLTPR